MRSGRASMASTASRPLPAISTIRLRPSRISPATCWLIALSSTSSTRAPASRAGMSLQGAGALVAAIALAVAAEGLDDRVEQDGLADGLDQQLSSPSSSPVSRLLAAVRRHHQDLRVCDAPSLDRIRLAVSMPSRPGIFQSRMTRSKRPSSNSARAARPDSTTVTSNVIAVNVSLRMSCAV